MAKTQVKFDREKREFVGLSEEHKKDLAGIYKGVDIETELKKMGLWLLSTKGKNRQGTIGFIMNWLGNATPNPPSTTAQLDLLDSQSPVSTLLLEHYLQDLWKNKDHIHKFNLIQKTR